MHLLLENLKVRSKLLLSFGLVALISLLVGIVGIFNIMRLQDMDSELYRYQTLPLLELRVINGCFEQNRAFMRDMILENDPEKIMLYIDEMEKNSNKINKSLQNFSQSLFTEAEKKEFAYFSNVLENFEYHRNQVIELGKAGNKQYAQTVLVSDGPKLSANFSKAIDRLSQIKEDTGRQTAEMNKSRAQTAIMVTGLLLVLTGIIAIGLGIVIARNISAPLVAVVTAANKISQGDLTYVLPDRYIGGKDELGQLGSAFSTMIANLKGLVTQVRHSSSQVASSSEELTASIVQSAQAAEQITGNIAGIAQGAERQLQSLTDTVAVVDQMSAGVRQIANNTATATITADKASRSAKDGGQAITLVISKMADIKRSVNNSAAVVAGLGTRSEEIGQIVSTIAGIASQTNLLALNAAIEAARAGEQGRGFAVVADEVRKLAEQSQQAAKQIADLISTIQHDTANAVSAMNEGTYEVNAGAEVVNDAGDNFKEIASFVLEMSGQIKEISAAVGQMTDSSWQIAETVSAAESISRNTSAVTQTVSAATQEQSAAMTEMTMSSESLAKLAEQLQQVVRQFNLSA